MDDFVRALYFLFLPLATTPYLIWVIHNEGKDPEWYFKEMYDGSVGLMWLVRIFMMLLIATFSSIVALLVLSAIGPIGGLF